jgi:hypothetical protein
VFYDFLNPVIYRFNRVGRIHRFPDFRGKLEKRNNFVPPVPPGFVTSSCTPPYGNETFLLMASEEPFPITESDFAEVDADSSSIERALRGLRYQDGQRSVGSTTPIATARFPFTILPKN